MSNINHYIANATGELNAFKDTIDIALERVIPVVQEELKANQIDIIFISAAYQVIPEYGIGGFTPGPNHIYVSFDPSSNKITQSYLEETLYHEIHHCMRWRNPGYGETLAEALITEGLACLYEEQHSGKAPLYARVKIKDDQIKLAKQIMDSKDYDHSEWFFGTKKIDRWFGYSYGYKLCKVYSDLQNTKASELVNITASKIIAVT